MAFSDPEKVACRRLVEAALAEDLGAPPRDCTSLAVIPADLRGQARFVARSAGVVAGLPAARLVQAAVDLSGRPYVVYEEPAGLAPYVGGTGPLFPTSLARHFWESLGHSARLTLHVVVVRASRPGSQPDAHHVLEAQVKAVARALRDAVRIESPGNGIPSTKGVL